MVASIDAMELTGFSAFSGLNGHTMSPYYNPEGFGFLRDIFAAHAVRKEKAEKALSAVNAEMEGLKASYEAQINNIVNQSKSDEADFLRQKGELEAQIQQKREQRERERLEAANSKNTAITKSSTADTTNTGSDTTKKGSNVLMITIIVASVLAVGGGIAYAVTRNNKKKRTKREE